MQYIFNDRKGKIKQGSSNVNKKEHIIKLNALFCVIYFYNLITMQYFM